MKPLDAGAPLAPQAVVVRGPGPHPRAVEGPGPQGAGWDAEGALRVGHIADEELGGKEDITAQLGAAGPLALGLLSAADPTVSKSQQPGVRSFLQPRHCLAPP